MKRLATISGAARYYDAYQRSYKVHSLARQAHAQVARAALRSAGWWV